MVTNPLKQGAITIRHIPINYPKKMLPIWNMEHHEWSHIVNGASLVMPYLEPFLIKNLREIVPLVNDADLKKSIKSFIGQEAQHFTHHRRYNERIKKNGYPKLALIEQQMVASYQRLGKKSLAFRLAYTAGFETMTLGLTDWIIKDRKLLFKGADPYVTSLILWHMVEEVEHKNVAFDVYEKWGGSYFLRIYGVFYATIHVIYWSGKGCAYMLKQDGKWSSWNSQLKLWRRFGRFTKHVLPFVFRSILPGFHPRLVKDPQWADQWRMAYDQLRPGDLPLLDTRHDIPPTFNQ